MLKKDLHIKPRSLYIFSSLLFFSAVISFFYWVYCLYWILFLLFGTLNFWTTIKISYSLHMQHVLMLLVSLIHVVNVVHWGHKIKQEFVWINWGGSSPSPCVHIYKHIISGNYLVWCDNDNDHFPLHEKRFLHPNTLW